ncbi:YwdI family protein [Aquibacillus salsiterrae]|uniref:YwdI family protein n=1 Tax=Aquibacillus salsiterrae TaxID=2950439 RepID=A0A9X4AEI1_9BACI|nr:YwdI family protein [Aquibacillus salsiterrae]MDC3416816.1 YwdI family protein [Aquibacillus salsiterrae]
MAISYEAVLRKMKKEIDEALSQAGKEVTVRERVRAVKLLCDLVLEEEGQGVGKTESEVGKDKIELRAMMGDVGLAKPKSTSKDEEANGDSIFDF